MVFFLARLLPCSHLMLGLVCMHLHIFSMYTHSWFGVVFEMFTKNLINDNRHFHLGFADCQPFVSRFAHTQRTDDNGKRRRKWIATVIVTYIVHSIRRAWLSIFVSVLFVLMKIVSFSRSFFAHYSASSQAPGFSAFATW